jgi:hypothetical protein
MDLELTGTQGFAWPKAEAAPARRQRSLRVPPTIARGVTVLLLYGLTVSALHGLASAFVSHPATSSSTGMCHRR